VLHPYQQEVIIRLQPLLKLLQEGQVLIVCREKAVNVILEVELREEIAKPEHYQDKANYEVAVKAE